MTTDSVALFFFLINHSSFLPALRETEDLEQVAQYGSKCINTNCGHKNIYESTSDNRRQIRHYRIGTRFKCPSIWLLLRNFLRGIFFLMLDCLLNWFKVKWRQLLVNLSKFLKNCQLVHCKSMRKTETYIFDYRLIFRKDT